MPLNCGLSHPGPKNGLISLPPSAQLPNAGSDYDKYRRAGSSGFHWESWFAGKEALDAETDALTESRCLQRQVWIYSLVSFSILLVPPSGVKESKLVYRPHEPHMKVKGCLILAGEMVPFLVPVFPQGSCLPWLRSRGTGAEVDGAEITAEPSQDSSGILQFPSVFAVFLPVLATSLPLGIR